MQPKALICLLLFCLLWLLTAVTAQPTAAQTGLTRHGPRPLAAAQTGPSLAIATGQTVTAGQSIQAPIAFQGNGNAIAAMIFSIDLDERCLTIDPTDQNQDGRPDAVALQLPAGLNASVLLDLSDTDGELDFTIADYFPPFILIPDRAALVTLTLNTTCQPPPGESIIAAVAFSTSPAPSFGNTNGASVTGSASDGSVIIVSSTAAPTITPTTTPVTQSTPTPTMTATAPPATTPTTTATPTLIPTMPPLTIVENFSATPATNSILLTWRTSSEANTAGFLIYRLDDNGGLTFQPISALLPAQGPSIYQFTDTAVLAGVRYTYLLVEQKHDGSLVEYDDLLVVVGQNDQSSVRLWLPLAQKK